MGSLRRKTFTRPLPENAELIQKKDQQFARWKDGSGKTRTAPTTTGRDGATRIVVESGKWLAKYRDASGIIREVATGCKDKGAAQSILAKLERRQELVRSEVISAAEESVADHQATRLAEHLESYIRSLKAAGRSDRHINDTERLARQIAADCGFRVLRDIEAGSVESWLVEKLNGKMAARTRNSYLTALKGFCSWCVRNRRLTTNPLAGIAKADEQSDRRKIRRAMTEAELVKLLYVARWRPLAEYGRETVRKPASKVTGKRKTWNPAPLTFETIDAAVERARERLADNPERIAELETRGRERALVLKTLLLTGLRSGELRSITVGQVHLDAAMPFIELSAKDEKNRDGSDIPLRPDLAEDLRKWLRSRRTSAPLRFDGGDALPADALLFYVPTGLRRILDRDLEAAGIPKKDDRGRTIDVHALRHTFGTMLSQNGVAPRTAQAAMRHSKIDLTMNVYTDPRLLDVSGALDALPTMSLTGDLNRSSEVVSMTGTDGQDDPILPPILPPGIAQSVHSESSAVTLAFRSAEDSDYESTDSNCTNTNEKGPLSAIDNGPLLRVSNGIRTRDLRNHNPAL